jgi:hypothetical protein
MRLASWPRPASLYAGSGCLLRKSAARQGCSERARIEDSWTNARDLRETAGSLQVEAVSRSRSGTQCATPMAMADETNPNGATDHVSNWTRACAAYNMPRDVDLEATAFDVGTSAQGELKDSFTQPSGRAVPGDLRGDDRSRHPYC